jgi:hypothetical protein
VAAILALLVAVGVPLWQRGSERKLLKNDRRAQTSALVFILMPDLITRENQLDQAEGSLPSRAAIIGRPPDGLFTEVNLPTLQKPPALFDHLDQIHVLGELAGICIMRLLVGVDNFNNAWRTEERLEAGRELRGRLRRLTEVLDEIWPGKHRPDVSARSEMGQGPAG